MTLGIDSEGGLSFAADQSIVPVGTIRGVYIMVTDNGTSSDNVTGVTINGVSMTQVALSPHAPGLTEPAVHHAFFMGSSIPSGTLDVDFSGSPVQAQVRYVAFTADADTEVLDTSTASAPSGTSASVTLNGDSAGVYGVAALQSNVGVTSGITPDSGHTGIGGETDYGNQVGGWIRTTNVVTTTPTFIMSWTVTSDDWMIHAASIREVPGAPVVTTAAHARGRGRATATRATPTITVAIHGRAKGRSTANGAVAGVTLGSARNRGHGYARATAFKFILTSTHGRAHGYSQARYAAAITGAAHGRAHGYAMAVHTDFFPGGAMSSRAHGYATAVGSQGSVFATVANDSDFLVMVAPLSPVRADDFQVARSRRPVSMLGRVTHSIIAPSGESRNPTIGEWFAEDDMALGYGPAGGVIAYEEFMRYPEVYVQGATWRTHHVESGTCVWAGRLTQPSPRRGAAVQLTGRGWGEIYMNRPLAEGTMYAHYGAEGWVDAGSDMMGGGGVRQFTQSISGASITFHRDKDPDRTGSTPTAAESQVMFTSPGTNIARLQFHLTAAAHGTPNTEFKLVIGSGSSARYDGESTLDWFRNYEEVHSIGAVITTDIGEFDIDLQVDFNGDPYLRDMRDMVSIYVDTQTTGAANGLRLNFRDIRVLGDAITDNELSAGQLVEDLMRRVGLPTEFIQDRAGPDMLPFEVLPGTTLADATAEAVLMSRRRLVIRGDDYPVPHFNSAPTRPWYVVDERHIDDLVQAELYDRVLVPFTVSTDQTVFGYRRVDLEDSPLERRNSFGALDWPIPVRARVVDTTGVYGIDDQRAEDLGLSILHILSKERAAGAGMVTEVLDENGTRTSARLIQAGDRVRYTYGSFSGPLLVTRVRHADNAVDLEFDNQVAMLLDRRRAKRELRKRKKMG